MAAVVERVDRLETALADFATTVGMEFDKLYSAQMRTAADLRAFREEMSEFKDEMRDFRNETRGFLDEMKHCKDQRKALKGNSQALQEERRQDRREMNRKWAEISNKLGTMVEDLVYPSLARVVRESLNQEVLDLSIRRKRRLPDGRVQEFDAIALTPDLVCLNVTVHPPPVDRRGGIGLRSCR